MSSPKKFTYKGTLRQVFICLRPPPLLGFCLGWSSNFAGSEYLTQGRGGGVGGGEPERRLEGQ
jgi:hypothetical protein